MIALVSIYVGGALTLLTAICHTKFYKIFQWQKEFDNVSQTNVRILYTIHLALLLLFFILGALSLVYARELSASIGLSGGLNVLLSMFWLWRLVWQLVYFKRAKGKKIPPIGLFFLTVFLLSSIAYLIPVLIRILN